jgi:glycosyltransferase involved in cell wall biosynthesis
MSVTLSVVVIARNEERNIGRCLESLVAETTGMEAEICLVDSASTDRTVEVARRFPVTVVCLSPSAPLSPAAGRYVGSQRATGDLVFFLDGDMAVCGGWLRKAVAAHADLRIGGVAGRLFTVRPGEELHMDHEYPNPLGKVRTFGGAAVYKKKSLLECGTFHPYLKGEEERELCYRLMRRGHELHRIAAPMAYHVTKEKTQAEIDEKAAYFTGIGQILRSYGLRGIGSEVLWDQRRIFAWPLALLLVLGGSLLLHRFGAPWYLPELLAFGALLSVLAAKGPRKLYLFVRAITLSIAHTVRGFFRGLPHPSAFDAPGHIREVLGPAAPPQNGP